MKKESRGRLFFVCDKRDNETLKKINNYRLEKKIEGVPVIIPDAYDVVEYSKYYTEGDVIISLKLSDLTGNTSPTDILQLVKVVLEKGLELHVVAYGLVITKKTVKTNIDAIDCAISINKHIYKERSDSAQKTGRPVGYRNSQLDKYYDEIKELCEEPGTTIKGLARKYKVEYPTMYSFLLTRGLLDILKKQREGDDTDSHKKKIKEYVEKLLKGEGRKPAPKLIQLHETEKKTGSVKRDYIEKGLNITEMAKKYNVSRDLMFKYLTYMGYTDLKKAKSIKKKK